LNWKTSTLFEEGKKKTHKKQKTPAAKNLSGSF